MARVILSRAKIELGELPAVCARCGVLDAELTPLTLPYVPTSLGQKAPAEIGVAAHVPAVAGLASVLGLGVLLHGLVTGRRLALILPLCHRHQETARRYAGPYRFASLALGCLALVATLLAFYTMIDMVRRNARLGDLGIHWLYCFAGLACGTGALLIRAKGHENFIFLFKVTDAEVELGGVAKNFVHASDPQAAQLKS